MLHQFADKRAGTSRRLENFHALLVRGSTDRVVQAPGDFTPGLAVSAVYTQPVSKTAEPARS
jgi:hypothetical protein